MPSVLGWYASTRQPPGQNFHTLFRCRPGDCLCPWNHCIMQITALIRALSAGKFGLAALQYIPWWELLYKVWFIPPTTLHRLTVHLWQSDNQQRERRHICNGAWHGGKCPCPVLFTFPTNGNCFALFIGTVSFQIYDKGCNPNHCTEDIKNKLKHGVVICLIDNLKDYSNSPNYGTRSKNSYS